MLSWPNRITITRTLLVPVFAILILNAKETPGLRWAALGVLSGIALGDILDGFLARRWNQQTRLGSMLDPLADKMLMVTACVLLAIDAVVRPWLPWSIPNWVVVIVIFRDVLLVGGSIATMLVGAISSPEPIRLGRATTVAQTSMLLGTLLGPELVLLFGGDWVQWLLWAPAAGLTVASGAVYVRMGARVLANGPSGGTPSAKKQRAAD